MRELSRLQISSMKYPLSPSFLILESSLWFVHIQNFKRSFYKSIFPFFLILFSQMLLRNDSRSLWRCILCYSVSVLLFITKLTSLFLFWLFVVNIHTYTRNISKSQALFKDVRCTVHKILNLFKIIIIKLEILEHIYC